MDDDRILIRARASVAGMRPGQVDWRPRERAEALIDGGYAVRAETLAERQASEPPNRHLDRNPLPLPATYESTTPLAALQPSDYVDLRRPTGDED